MSMQALWSPDDVACTVTNLVFPPWQLGASYEDAPLGTLLPNALGSEFTLSIQGKWVVLSAPACALMGACAPARLRAQLPPSTATFLLDAGELAAVGYRRSALGTKGPRKARFSGADSACT